MVVREGETNLNDATVVDILLDVEVLSFLNSMFSYCFIWGDPSHIVIGVSDIDSREFSVLNSGVAVPWIYNCRSKLFS